MATTLLTLAFLLLTLGSVLLLIPVVAGQLAGYQMGFALANVVDPASSLQIPMLAQFLNLFAMMIFLSLDIHYYFIQALVDGFDLIPIWGAHFSGNLFEYMMGTMAKTFVIAIQLGAPVMVALPLAGLSSMIS